MIFGYLGAPSFYKQFVIDLVNDNPKLATCMAKAGRLYSADIYICVVMIMFIYSLLSTGVKTNSKGKTTTALLVFIFFIVALLRIYFFKITPNSEFSEMIGCEQPEDGEEPDENDPNQYVVENIQQDLAEFFTENMSVFNSIQVFGIFIFLFLITMSILLATNSISLWFFGTLLDIYIIIFYVVKSNANKGGDDDEE
jgi:Ca2+/Na+ antiporter